MCRFLDAWQAPASFWDRGARGQLTHPGNFIKFSDPSSLAGKDGWALNIRRKLAGRSVGRTVANQLEAVTF